MFRKYWWLLVLMGVLALVVSGCDDSDGGDVDADDEGTIISGRLAQTYVSGAIVFADQVTGADGLGDFRADPAVEVSTYSESDGSYTLVIPPGYGEYVLCSKGGTVRNSQGVRVPALPMLASQGATNLTLVTTLVALHPSLKNKIGDDFDEDIASPNGVPWQILQLAKVAEAYMSVIVEGNDPLLRSVEDEDGVPVLSVVELKFSVLQKLARALVISEIDIDDESDVTIAVVNAVGELGDDSDIEFADGRFEITVVLAGILETMSQSILVAVPDGGIAVEETVLPDAEAAVSAAMTIMEGNTLAFSPSDSVLPIPNDIVWSQSGGHVYLPPPADAPDQAALYTAINALELKGLSPNTPIAIPLENATPIDEELLNAHIRLINTSALLGMVYVGLDLGDPTAVSPDRIIADIKAQLAADPQATMTTIQTVVGQNMAQIFGRFKAVQEENFIKIYPLTPLGAGSRYLAVVLERVCDGGDMENGACSVFSDINGVPVTGPLLYEFLTLDEPLTGELEALEDLRLSYAPIYNDLLPLLGMSEENTLEIFTFTTAEKTLSVQDFGVLSAYLQQFVTGEGDMTLDDVAAAIGDSDNLPYSAITAEYATIHASLPEQPTGVNVNPDLQPEPGVFISVDIAASTPGNPVQTTVPYDYLNSVEYDRNDKSIVIFGHGITRSKEDAELLFGPNGIPMPVIAMDLPLHGERTPGSGPSGAEFFTSNLPQSRINVYQSCVDLTILLRNLRSGLFDLDDDGAVFIPGRTDPDPEDVPNNVFFVGQSLGAITGSVFATFNPDALDKAVLNVGGGNLAVLFDEATSDLIMRLVSSLGSGKNSNEYFTTLGILQTFVDPADPVNLVTDAISETTIIQSAFGDSVVPNVSNQVLATAAGHPQMVPVVDFTVPPSAEPGWYMFGGEPGYISHGFLLNPQVETGSERFDPDYVLGAYASARDQIARFLGD